MNKKVVIAGGNSFIGQYLAQQFGKLDYEVIIISRHQPHILWDDEAGIIKALEHADMLINLAGKSVNCRYNNRNKKEILKSRTETTKAIGEAILKCNHPPALWLNASTATIYRHAEDRPMTESNGEIGTGFSVGIAKEWEKEFFSFQLTHTRQIALRTAIVLGKSGGAIKPLVNLVRFGLGGKQGNGRQMFSWIHIDDVLNIILFLQSHTELKGVFNVTSPNPVDNKTFMKALRHSLNITIGLPSPSWLLAIGAVVIKTETELVLKSRWVVPEKLLEQGYTFKYPTIETALADIVNKRGQ